MKEQDSGKKVAGVLVRSGLPVRDHVVDDPEHVVDVAAMLAGTPRDAVVQRPARNGDALLLHVAESVAHRLDERIELGAVEGPEPVSEAAPADRLQRQRREPTREDAQVGDA